MKKLLIALVVGLGIGTLASVAHADSGLFGGYKAYLSTTVFSASGTVTTNSCVVYKIINSTGNGINFSVLYDTVVIAGLTSSVQLEPWRASPAILFSSATFTSGAIAYPGTNNQLDYTPNGIRCKFGAYLLKTTGNSGEANVTQVLFGN